MPAARAGGGEVLGQVGSAVNQFEGEAVLKAHRTKPSMAAALRRRSSTVMA
jgi:hypothetical protein